MTLRMLVSSPVCQTVPCAYVQILFSEQLKGGDDTLLLFFR
jgi:hypothetical protein